MKRLPTDYNQLVEDYESIFSDDDLFDMEQKSEILSFEEVMEYMMIDVAELSESDKQIAERICKRGGHKGVYENYTRLQGTQGAEFYLKHKASSMAEQAQERDYSGAFNLNINVDEKE